MRFFTSSGKVVPSREVPVRAEVEVPERQRQPARVAVVLEDAARLGDDLGPDAVAGEDGDELLAVHGLVRPLRVRDDRVDVMTGQAPSAKSWPMPGTSVSFAPAIARAVASPPETLMSGSSTPWMTAAGSATFFEARPCGLAG